MTCLPITSLDHAPILVGTFKKGTFRKYNFYFQTMWINHPTCNEVINQVWHNTNCGSISFQVLSKLNETRHLLKLWDKEVFGNFKAKIRMLKDQLEDLQQILQSSTHYLIKEARE